jgi:hypothetical protein
MVAVRRRAVIHCAALSVAPVNSLSGLPDLQAPCSADYESSHSSRVAGARVVQYDSGDPHSCKLSMEILYYIESYGACIARKRDVVQESCSIWQSKRNSAWGSDGFLHTLMTSTHLVLGTPDQHILMRELDSCMLRGDINGLACAQDSV